MPHVSIHVCFLFEFESCCSCFLESWAPAGLHIKSHKRIAEHVEAMQDVLDWRDLMKEMDGRAEGGTKQGGDDVQQASDLLCKTRVLNLETRLLRTVDKSKNPGKRIPGMLTEFTQANGKTATSAVSEPLRLFLVHKGWAEDDQ